MSDKKKISTGKTGIIAGALAALAFIAYYLILHLLNLERNLYLRHVNQLFLITSTILATGYYKKHNEERFDYMKCLSVCFFTVVMASLAIALITVIYLNINTELMEYIKNEAVYGWQLSPLDSGAVVFTELVAFGAIYTMAIVVYYSRSYPRKSDGEQKI